MQDRSDYANGPGPIRLYPDFSARMWEAFGCAPLVVTGPELMAARAGRTLHGDAGCRLTGPPVAHLIVTRTARALIGPWYLDLSRTLPSGRSVQFGRAVQSTTRLPNSSFSARFRD